MFSIFKNIFSPQKQQKKKELMKKSLIVGLGNIGSEYEETRHNIGFKIADAFAKKKGISFETVKLGDLARCKLKGRTIYLLKPTTYMNLSGKAVRYWMMKEKIALENILVITDDLNLPFGTIRLKAKGSSGGHNGLKSIEQQLQTSSYSRFRFGVGDAFQKGKQVNYVLGEWNQEEKKALPERLDKSVEVIESFVVAGLANTMNSFNGK